MSFLCSCFNNRASVVAPKNSVNYDIKSQHFDINDYKNTYLSNGAYGKVYKININNTLLTCKKLKKYKTNSIILREIKILKEIQYEKYLPRFYKAIETNTHYYVLYEYISGVDLFQMILKPSFDISNKRIIAQIIKEITLGLYSLFKFNYIHLDIKPENILIKKTLPIRIKLIDLAFCQKLDEKNHLSEVIGTSGYISPEVLFFKRYFHNTDVWSLGVISYILMTNEALFKKDNFYKDLKGFNRLSKKSHNLKDLDKNQIDILSKMIEKNCAKRLSLKNVLNHKFIVSNTDSIVITL